MGTKAGDAERLIAQIDAWEKELTRGTAAGRQCMRPVRDEP